MAFWHNFFNLGISNAYAMPIWFDNRQEVRPFGFFFSRDCSFAAQVLPKREA